MIASVNAYHRHMEDTEHNKQRRQCYEKLMISAYPCSEFPDRVIRAMQGLHETLRLVAHSGENFIFQIVYIAVVLKL